MSEKIWSDDAWEDYLYWQTQDKKTLKRINQLIQDIERNGCMKGIGKPEPLSGDLQGEYSRRINEKDRLVYHNDESTDLESFPQRNYSLAFTYLPSLFTSARNDVCLSQYVLHSSL